VFPFGCLERSWSVSYNKLIILQRHTLFYMYLRQLSSSRIPHEKLHLKMKLLYQWQYSHRFLKHSNIPFLFCPLKRKERSSVLSQLATHIHAQEQCCLSRYIGTFYVRVSLCVLMCVYVYVHVYVHVYVCVWERERQRGEKEKEICVSMNVILNVYSRTVVGYKWTLIANTKI
jgi:hypothetical protein